jgi:hypothetical protein
MMTLRQPHDRLIQAEMASCSVKVLVWWFSSLKITLRSEVHEFSRRQQDTEPPATLTM